MNVYDFDKTIFYPDSSYCFYRYCLKRLPAAVLPTLPKSLVYGCRYGLGRIKAKALKEQLFSFLPAVNDVDGLVSRFWEEHESGLQSWYLAQKREDDLIISASPEFLLRPIAEKLGVGLIGTPMDPGTGKIRGENCHDTEKTRRFRDLYPEGHVESFYSDSLSDSPMAAQAERAYLVNRGERKPWPVERLNCNHLAR